VRRAPQCVRRCQFAVAVGVVDSCAVTCQYEAEFGVEDDGRSGPEGAPPWFEPMIADTD
jgi:hypothetical protein